MTSSIQLYNLIKINDVPLTYLWVTSTLVVYFIILKYLLTFTRLFGLYQLCENETILYPIQFDAKFSFTYFTFIFIH